MLGDRERSAGVNRSKVESANTWDLERIRKPDRYLLCISNDDLHTVLAYAYTGVARAGAESGGPRLKAWSLAVLRIDE